MKNKNAKSHAWGLNHLHDLLAVTGYDPVKAHIGLALGAEDEKIRYQANRDLLDLLIPKPKRILFSEENHEDAEQERLVESLKVMLKEYERDY